MTQTPHDQLAKQYLEEFLAPFGVVQRQYEGEHPTCTFFI
jgi:hypothetical protein